MVVIFNKSKSVKVLKAVGVLPLRLFPGHNYVDQEKLEVYFKNNIAAQEMRKEYFSIVDEKGLTIDERTIATRAKERNDELNRAQKIIKRNDEKISSQDDQIKKLLARIEELEKANKKGK